MARVILGMHRCHRGATWMTYFRADVHIINLLPEVAMHARNDLGLQIFRMCEGRSQSVLVLLTTHCFIYISVLAEVYMVYLQCTAVKYGNNQTMYVQFSCFGLHG